MSTFVESLKNKNKLWILVGLAATLLIVAKLNIPTYNRSLGAAEADRQDAARQYAMRAEESQISDSLANSSPVAAALTSGTVEGTAPAAPPDRKIVRTSSLEMTVTSPVEAAGKIALFAEGLGGYVESSQVNSSADAPTATITIRVPASHLEETKAALRKMAVRVDSENTDAKDVTREYVDMDARLRNLRAEEAQYLQIMKSAAKVTDMLAVSEKLSEVRGQIEQQQTEFQTLSKQVETVAIAIALHMPVQPAAFGFNWHPMDRLRASTHDALDALASYASTMLAAILFVPVIVLWGATGLLGVFIGWKVARLVRRVFAIGKPATPVTQTN